MTRRNAWIRLLAVAVLSTSAVGCLPGRYTGGGWLPSVVPDSSAKAVFACSIDASDEDGDGIADTVRGQVQYHDRAAGVGVHGVVLDGGISGLRAVRPGPDGEFGTEDDLFADVYVVSGTYEPIGNVGTGGVFEAGMFDWGDPGPDEADVVGISLIGGIFDGYAHSADVSGGNFTLHRASE